MVVQKLERALRVTVRFTADELAMLQTMMDASGFSASDIMRSALRQAYAAAHGDKRKH